ncbi:DUF4352 domain-containing protein [Microbispora hainanensis]|uniref:DUF4352 domain-containing protein n=1 Tax=Microbispora hainanensis TaxID=568844 RepID=A0A544YHA3_9ACTN|nr:DUF4352 domain-containing protein [Microbispora hainanensis]TQS16131.1 DUF4352 domain-containing protein [Microbispora hainanensis]
MAYPQGPQDPQQWHTQPGQFYGPPPGYGSQPPQPPKKSSNTGLIVLAVIGGLCLVLFAGCAALIALSGGNTPEVVTATAPADTTMAEPQQQVTEETQDQAAEEQSQQQTTEQSQDRTAEQGVLEPAEVGGTLTLEGRDPGVKVDVTVTKVVEKATPASDFLKPKSGNRYVAIEFRIKNKGRAVYSDAPSNGAKLIDDQGQQYNTTYGEVREGVLFGAITVSPGDIRKGVVLYEIPESVKLAKFQFALNSGFADQKGEWVLT